MNQTLRWTLAAAVALGAAAPVWAGAQTPGETVTVAPGPQYDASKLEETWLGSDYRYLWTTPIRVEVLDLRTFAGGLTPTRRGGGLQTRSLRFRGADGRQYAFRSVNKYPDMTREPSLRGTVVAEIIQDQTSSLHPAGALVAAALLEAVGLPHPTPRLFVMPDDPALGEFRQDFAGMLGQLEERPDELEDDRPGLGGFRRIISTDRLFERLEESAEDRVDARAFLVARLVDVLIGDWDRHEDNWRWGAAERGGVRIWTPIPRDRDYAFVDYDGILLQVGRTFVPNAVKFSPTIHKIYGLTLNGRPLDRRFLAELDRSAWNEAVAHVRSRLTDEVIDRAMLRMPPELRALSAERISSRLKSRRDDLPRAVDEFYELLASEVDVHGTDEADVALIERSGGGDVEVRLYDADGAGGPRGEPYFRRRFVPAETNEVRVYMHGGDDRVQVRGEATRGLTVRVIGGGGDDLLADSSQVRGGGGKTAFYDSRGENRFQRGPLTRVDTREYEEPGTERELSGESFRDWGRGAGLQPVVAWRGTEGIILGVGETNTRFGFRKFPYAYQWSWRFMVGTASGAVGAEVLGDVRLQNSPNGYSFRLSASQLEPIRFFGFGNDTERMQPTRFYVVRQNRLEAETGYNLALPGGARLHVGPRASLTRSQVPEGTPFAGAHAGERNFGQAGAQAELRLDRRENRAFPRHGARLRAGAAGYPAVWGAGGAFGEVHATASGYWTPLRSPYSPTLALRTGAKRVWGDFPIHEAAFLGGSGSLRGHSFQRFAGDAMAFANADVRIPLGEANLMLVRGDLGVLALADAGRVFHTSDVSDRWHRAIGGGLWFRFTVRNAPLATSLFYAQGEVARIYLKLGAPF